jgi:hypothetical protein
MPLRYVGMGFASVVASNGILDHSRDANEPSVGDAPEWCQYEISLRVYSTKQLEVTTTHTSALLQRPLGGPRARRRELEELYRRHRLGSTIAVPSARFQACAAPWLRKNRVRPRTCGGAKAASSKEVLTGRQVTNSRGARDGVEGIRPFVGDNRRSVSVRQKTLRCSASPC